MPGIITHYKVFSDSVALLRKIRKRNYLHRSIDALFRDEDHLRAAHFGAVGPNIFDYIPRRSKNVPFGHELSFMLHNGGSEALIPAMIKRIYSYEDKNNEWASMQRAYLYGFISHHITDCFFHPFVFYHSGFPDSADKKRIRYFRHQNLVFEYNMDNYWLYDDDDATELNFSLKTMLPPPKSGRFNPAIKSLIMENIHECFPDQYNKIILKKKQDEGDFASHFSWLDLIPSLMKKAYSLKWNSNNRIRNLLKDILRKYFIYSDFLVQYPLRKHYNHDVHNFHKSRWDYPAGKKGLVYDSIETLSQKAAEETVGFWEKLESSLYANPDTGIFSEFSVNAYTGQDDADYFQMFEKEPVRLYL